MYVKDEIMDTHCSERPDLTNSLGSNIIREVVEVEDELWKLTTVMTLPLANIFQVVSFGGMRLFYALLQLGLHSRLLLAHRSQLLLKSSRWSRARALGGEGLIEFVMRDDSDTGLPQRILILSTLVVALQYLFLCGWLSVYILSQLCSRALSGSEGLRSSTKGRIDGIGHVSQRSPSGSHSEGVVRAESVCCSHV